MDSSTFVSVGGQAVSILVSALVSIVVYRHLASATSGPQPGFTLLSTSTRYRRQTLPSAPLLMSACSLFRRIFGSPPPGHVLGAGNGTVANIPPSYPVYWKQHTGEAQDWRDPKLYPDLYALLLTVTESEDASIEFRLDMEEAMEEAGRQFERISLEAGARVHDDDDDGDGEIRDVNHPQSLSFQFNPSISPARQDARALRREARNQMRWR